MGPVRVELPPTTDLRAGRFDVVATLRQAAGGVGAGSLVLPSGQRISLGDRPVTIGRMRRLHDPAQRPERQPPPRRDPPGPRRLRRRRPRLDERHDGQRHAHPAASSALTDGDILSFGSTYVRFEAS